MVHAGSGDIIDRIHHHSGTALHKNRAVGQQNIRLSSFTDNELDLLHSR